MQGEGLIRVLITVMLIGLVVMAIIFFSIFGMVPAENLNKVLKGTNSTSTAKTTGEKTVVVNSTNTIERIIEKEVEKDGPSLLDIYKKILSLEKEDNSENNEDKKDDPIENNDNYKNNLVLEGGVFNPTTFYGEKGDTIKIRVTSNDNEYRVMIPDYGLAQTVSPSSNNKLIEFQAMASGEFSILCDGCQEGFYGRLIINN